MEKEKSAKSQEYNKSRHGKKMKEIGIDVGDQRICKIEELWEAPNL